MTKAVEVRPAVDLDIVPDVDAAADLVLYLGLRDLPPELIPARAVTVDGDTGEVLTEEADRDYVLRVWPGMPLQLKYMAVSLGVRQATIYKDKLGDGINYIVWKAFDNGWWMDPDEGVSDIAKAFRPWVVTIMTQEKRSNSDASQLANTILNLVWLRDNDYKGLPVDDLGLPTLEPIFKNDELYQRWRRVTGKLRALIEAKQEGATNGEITQQIKDLIKDINDPEKTLTDLDQVGRKKPRVPPIVMWEEPGTHRDKVDVTATLSPSQRSMLQQRLGKDLEYHLAGETYDITQRVLACYRGDTRLNRWYRREWLPDETKYSAFVPSADPATVEGYEDRPKVDDSELGLVYVWQWEEKDATDAGAG